MARYFTADLHLGETRLELMGRPFNDPWHNDNAIIVEINDIVTAEDELIIVGDVVSKSATHPERSLKLLSGINGKKTLIRGNHDEQFTDEQLAPYFDKIIPHGEGLDLTIDDLDVHVTHYPTLGKSDKFNLVGHIHGAWKVQLNMLNIGVDANHFKPLNEKQIKFMYTAICDFYDRDVWVAYENKNDCYKDIRGKKTSYFNELKKPAKLGSRVEVIHEPVTYTELENLVSYWRDLACEQQRLAFKRRPLSNKIIDVFGYVLFNIYCMYQIIFKGRRGPFS